MKKTYTSPATVMVSVETVQMIAQSVQSSLSFDDENGTGTTTVSNTGAGNAAMGRTFSVWGDDDEE